MDMSLFWPALLTGIFCYLGAIETPWLFGMTGGFYIVGRPLVAGLLVGLAFGDVKAGILCGVAVQGVFIANLSTGGTTNSEITYAAYGGIGLAMATTKNPAVAVTLSILIGQTFGLIFYNARMALYSYWNTKATDAARKVNYKGIVWNHLFGPQITTFLFRALPTFLVIFLGKGLINTLLHNIPAMATHIIQVLGGVLPALGIALLMAIVIKNKAQLIFFLAGFVLLAFSKMSMIEIVFIAVLVAYLYFIATKNSNSGSNTQMATNNAEKSTVDTDDEYEDDDLF